MMTDENAATRYWDRFLGVTGPKDPRLREISPIDHVDAVTVPVLLIHGRDDTVVPYSQSEEMAKALKAAGKSVEFVSLPHEDHGLSRSATREQMLEAVVRFLEQNDPPN
jgi:dipeptidyl aminopeptidase/acylaminoacyl peptidase